MTSQTAGRTTLDVLSLPRVIVVSDSPLIRAGIRALMPHDRVEVVADLDGPDELLHSVKTTATQVVIAAPVDDGDALFAVIGTLPTHCTAIGLLAIPSFRIQSTVLTSRHAIRCLPLTVGRTELCAAVEQSVDGENSQLTVEEVASGPYGRLTPREQEILRELTLGRANREIADNLWVSENTVKTHLRKIYRKLGVDTRAEAVALYVGFGRA